jgi:hypothetical protein
MSATKVGFSSVLGHSERSVRALPRMPQGRCCGCSSVEVNDKVTNRFMSYMQVLDSGVRFQPRKSYRVFHLSFLYNSYEIRSASSPLSVNVCMCIMFSFYADKNNAPCTK